MAKNPFNFGGGSGNGSDDCTAEAKDVLKSVTAIYSGSDDEPEYGTMEDYSNITLAATSEINGSYIELIFPSTGKYNAYSKLYVPYSTFASLIGVSANKIATGNTVLGVTGTYTGLGNATVGQVLSGKTFSTASLSNASGTMTNVASIDPAKSVSLSSGTLYCRMTNGAHITNASSGYPEVSVPQDTLASAINLTASKIISGNTILGISGTAVSPGSASSTGLDLYAFGQEGVSCTVLSSNTSSKAISSTAGIVTKTSTCVVFSTIGWVNYVGALVFSGNTIPVGSYSTIHIQGRTCGYSGNWGMRVYYNSKVPTSYNSPGTQLGSTVSAYFSTGSSTTVTIPYSGVSGSYYLALHPSNSDSSWNNFILEHMWLT